MPVFVFDELDKTQGRHVWRTEDYLALIRRERAARPFRVATIAGYDNLPYENVLPWERKFRQEYEALPRCGAVTLKGELLKEARSWGLQETWEDKAAFVRDCMVCRRDCFAINRRKQNLNQVIDRICWSLRTPENCRTVDAFIAQNRKEVAEDTQDLLRFAARGGRPLWTTGTTSANAVCDTRFRRLYSSEDVCGPFEDELYERLRQGPSPFRASPPRRKGLLRRIWDAVLGA